MSRNNEELNHAIKSVAHSITASASPGRDETGGYVASLTEAVMGITSGLYRVAEALEDIADAIREGRE